MLGEKIEEVLGRCGLKKTTLRVHPYVYAYINQGLLSIKRKWKFKYGNRLQVVPSQMLGFLEYEFYDDNDSLFELESSAL